MTEEGTLELRIDRFSEFVANNPEKQLFSAPTYIHGYFWRIVVKPSSEPDSRLIFLECTGGDDIPNWSCKVSATLHFVSQKEGADDHIVKTDHIFSKENDSVQLSGMCCSTVLDPNERFIKDNTVIFRVHVKAEVPQSVRIAKITSSISDPTDVDLIVGTNRIPIHKTYLEFYSEYFKTMFQSEVVEYEFVIEVEYEEMIELLAVIYPSAAPINALNLESILKLADRFKMPAILERCKKELRNSTLNDAEKLLLAQMYNFEDLQMVLAQQYRTAEDANKLKSEQEYNQLDYETRALVSDSIDF
ncbi:BTB/POZ domain-containing protein [Ditylenchus destructor]|uniref:BTB/POZ domain-containing protein n=1 Tax=Ditylenchus destructor TaxID=166010 RepID=A0AAD4QWU5_9BILA|nr:BTB/POZ domain-containing protein [Ditylenchus destructor]